MNSDGRSHKGLFISFEGGDGVGKSTQIKEIAGWLQAQGHRVVETREPGGAPGAEAIRTLLVTGAADRWTPLSEALMMSAARAEHLAATIRPALDRGEIVLCDRFSDSTMAYQGHAGALGPQVVDHLNALVVGRDMPDLTLILHLPAGAGLARAQGRGGAEHRFEEKGDAYQASVAQAFEKIATDNPERCVLINAGDAIEAVTAAIVNAIETRLGARLAGIQGGI